MKGREAGRGVTGVERSLARIEELLERLEAARARIGAAEDSEAVIETLGELAGIAKEVEAEIERAKREVDARA